MSRTRQTSIFSSSILKPAILDAIIKLDPRTLITNPVIFAVELAAVAITFIFIRNLFCYAAEDKVFLGQLSAWLWFTVLFANFAEAVAVGKGKAQAAAMRKGKAQLEAKVLATVDATTYELVPATQIETGTLVLVETGDTIPSDGDVIEGMAAVDESAITGESAPVIRESGGDRCAVTGGTRVISDSIKVRVTATPGDTFMDRMINLVEGAQRKKTPNEIALNMLLMGFTVIFTVVTASIEAFMAYDKGYVSIALLLVLFVTLIPTTIAGLLSAIGISGMDRLLQANVLALSGRAVEAAGDVDTLLLDKTGTITLGNRMATEFVPLAGVTEAVLAEAALLSSLSDDTPEGRSIVILAMEKYGLKREDYDTGRAEFVPFSAYTRLSGVNLPNSQIRKGAVASVVDLVKKSGRQVPANLDPIVEKISKEGATPLVVYKDGAVLGVIRLKDVVKKDISERFARLRRMGVRTIMITGDNPLTAAAIAAEAGVDDFLAQATPQTKLDLIRREQALGRMVAMCGDGTNDAPALAQADVGVAMASGTSAAREAANMVDLDSDPTKMIEIITIGKQLLMTRGALTTFSITNDVAKYFAIIPALFMASYPQLQSLNIMHLASAESAVLSAVIFNAVVIIALIPMALKGVKYQAVSVTAALKRNLLIYGLGGILIPFAAIKCIDLLISCFGIC
ncbi:potassium-transporting ATPase subunit KdpB [soil metagenome]